MKTVIFDLDNTLSASTEVGDTFFDPVFSAMREANNGSVPEDVMNQACEDIWQTAFDAVTEKYKLPQAVVKAGWAEYAKFKVNKSMRGYENPHLLKSMPARLFLVTSGFQRLKQSKTDALGFASMFEEVHIDATDEHGHPGKRAIFEDIMTKHGLRCIDVYAVGENPESEIEVGNDLTCKPCRYCAQVSSAA